MPVFEYHCSNSSCNRYLKVKEELLLSSEDPSNVRCEICNIKLTRLLSATPGKVIGGTPSFYGTRGR